MLGSVKLTLGGYVDLTGYYRSRNENRGTGTGYNSIPFEGPTPQGNSGELGLILWALVISMIANGLSIVNIYLYALAVGADVSLAKAAVVAPAVLAVGLLPISLNGLGLIEGTFRTCPHCEGRGMIRSVSSCGLGVLRSIEDNLMKRAENLTVTCAPEVASYLLNDKRDSLLILEQTYNVTVFIVPGHHDMKGMQTTIERAPDREIAPRRAVVNAPVRMDSAFNGEEEEAPVEEADVADEAEDETQDEQAEARSDDGEQRDGERQEGGRKRRRRGRRGGRRGDRSGEGEQRQTEGDVSAEADGEDDAPSESGVESVDDNTSDEVSDVGGAGDSEASDSEAPRRDGNRRDRFGRNRNRRRNRGDRGDRGERQASVDNANQSSSVTDLGGEDIPGEPMEQVERERDERPERQSGRRDRGDRNGRGRDRHNRGERGERGPRPERNDRQEREAFVPVQREAAPPIVIPDVIPDPEPRKWQPPAPTIQAAPEAKKGGWWSKRK